MTARVSLPDAAVIAIYCAAGQQKNVAVDFGVSIATVSQIKCGRRHGELIRKHLADEVRASSAALATKAFYPQLLVEWGGQ